jgi:antirestriction protein ArdC
VGDLAILFLHLLATVARLAGPGGARSVVAESVLVKHQLLILNRSRKRSPIRDAESYYATLAHETTHWTAYESRLARVFGTKRFGSEGYAIEDLVAELDAAFLCADLDLALEPREDHAAYIANWLDVLAADNRANFAAASHAQRAAGFINGLQPASGC